MVPASLSAKIRGIDWTRPSLIALVLANLVPVFGVLFLGWEVFPLLLIFWFENVIIGGFNVLRMLLASPDEPLSWAGKFVLIPFFCVHYGMFTFVHGSLLIGFFGGGSMHGFMNLDLIRRTMAEYHVGWAVFGLVVSHGISFATNYLGSGEFRRASLPVLMMQPYGRVVVLHLTILFGGFVMLALKSPVIGLLLLVILKLGLDIFAHDRERKKLAGGPDAARGPVSAGL